MLGIGCLLRLLLGFVCNRGRLHVPILAAAQAPSPIWHGLLLLNCCLLHVPCVDVCVILWHRLGVRLRDGLILRRLLCSASHRHLLGDGLLLLWLLLLLG